MDDPDATILHTSADINVDDILRKYGIGATQHTEPLIELRKLEQSPLLLTTNQILPKVAASTSNKKTKLQVYSLSDSDGNDEFNSPVKKLSRKQRHTELSSKQTTRRRSPNSNVDLNRKALLAIEKAQKKQDAENKKLEAAKNKEIKKVLSEVNKQLKPDECLKFITAIVDESIPRQYDINIEFTFKELGSNFRVQSQIIPNTVTWTRLVYNYEVDDNCGPINVSSTVKELPDLLLILSAEELINFVNDNKLLEYIKSIESIYMNKSMSLGVVGLDKHLKCMEKEGGLSSNDVMVALTEVQIFCNCCYRNLDGPPDLAAMLSQYTKAIAQRPYKLQQQEKYAATNWYMQGDNKDCVKVDKKGNGLKRLWQQQITSFPLARLEVAESIIDKYPTVNHLMEAYDFSVSKERETLLVNIAVRRHAGPVTTSRKIGIEMSKKINIFYNSLDGESTIN